MRKLIPLKKRPLDIGILSFFWINILFITYLIDLEQLVIADVNNFEYPLWPPPFIIDLVHWWGRNFDPALMAREPWWRATIWIDQLFFGPFYILAIYAFTKSKEWIRIPSIVYASMLLTNVIIILWEEILGQHASNSIGIVLMANAAWVIMPLLIIFRFRNNPHPFTEETD
ncbi:MAG TPA: emopamil-binding family protein [Cyclobacteriaceae bacterium]|jgi:hypothetical protein